MSKLDLIRRDHAHLIHSLHDPEMVASGHVWTRGEGAVLVDADGKEYIDGLSGLWNVVAGHGRRELVDAAAEQMMRLAYASGYSGSSNERAIELAERLAGLTYSNINRFFFTSGGGESIDSAIKTARFYWKSRGHSGKTKVISLESGYHGVTMAAMCATGISGYWPMFEPRMPGFIHIPSPHPYRYQTPLRDASSSPGVAAANELEEAILREGPETVAMFLAEPIQGSGGVLVPPDDYFPRVREICDRHDVLLVADEVITGFGRSGRMFGLQHWGVEPDMFTFAKAVTSGYFPLGGIGVSDQIAEAIDAGPAKWMHCFTYSGHPVGCAVALRNLDIIEQEDFPAQADVKGEYLIAAIRAALGDHPNLGDLRGKGLMCGVEFVEVQATKTSFAPEERVGPRILEATRQRGLFSRIRGDTYCLAPPIITSHDQLDRIAETLAESVRAILPE